MRVVVDATPLLVRSAGVKNYLFHWILHLRRAAGNATARHVPGHGTGARAGSTRLRWRVRCARSADWRRSGISNHTGAPLVDWMTRGADVFHASVLVRYPPSRPRLTATVHDLTGVSDAGAASRDRTWWRSGVSRKLARRADGLIAVSECTRQDAVRTLGIAPEKICTIHSGVADDFFDPPAARVDEVRLRYGLQRPFVLFVGTIEPRKNVDLLLDALKLCRDRCASNTTWWWRVRRAGRRRPPWRGCGRCRYLGYVPERDLAPLTAAAEVFVYPSLYEGFGFPVAQAMAAGVAVITSNVSSLPEVAGGAALLVDPRSQSEIAGGTGSPVGVGRPAAGAGDGGPRTGARIPLGSLRPEVAGVLPPHHRGVNVG